jgi:hypothetical protein
MISLFSSPEERKAVSRILHIVLVAVAAVAVALLAAHGPAVRAQPVASITLPDPCDTERTVDLYPGCNNIALTFPDGTASATVVQAVTPAGAVESMWRYNAAERKWDGYSPAFPEFASLLTVNYHDAVWLCMAGAPAPVPTAPPHAPTATATPAPTVTPLPPPAPTATPPAGQTPAARGFVAPTDVLSSFAYTDKLEISTEAEGEFVIYGTIEGEFEAPDRLTCTTSMSFDDSNMVMEELVVVGNDAWISTFGELEATNTSDPGVAETLEMCPGSRTFWEKLDIGDLGSLPGQPETVNGVAAVRYSLRELHQVAVCLGGDLSILGTLASHTCDIWLAEDGHWPVRLAADAVFASGEGYSDATVVRRLDITEPNSPDIHVEPPGQ